MGPGLTPGSTLKSLTLRQVMVERTTRTSRAVNEELSELACDGHSLRHMAILQGFNVFIEKEQINQHLSILKLCVNKRQVVTNDQQPTRENALVSLCDLCIRAEELKQLLSTPPLREN